MSEVTSPAICTFKPTHRNSFLGDIALKIRRSFAFLSVAGAAAATIAALPASAGSATDTAACTVVGSVSVAPGPAPTGASSTDVFNFASTTISCPLLPTSPAAGTWTGVTATGTADSVTNPVTGLHENCAEGASTGGPAGFTGHFTGGVNGTKTITGGDFTFLREGALVEVLGSIHAHDSATGQDQTYDFNAELTFVPSTGGCAVPPGSGTTTASMTGVAVIEDAATPVS